MTSLDIIKSLCDGRGINISLLEKELGYGNGSLAKAKKMPAERIHEIAKYFNVSMEYLMPGDDLELKRLITETESEPKLTPKDERDIERILEQARGQLMSQEGLMFDGEPASPEAVDSILSAMQVGMEMAKLKNKEKYTPKKYKKD